MKLAELWQLNRLSHLSGNRIGLRSVVSTNCQFLFFFLGAFSSFDALFLFSPSPLLFLFSLAASRGLPRRPDGERVRRRRAVRTAN